jgi:hypothetical protein
MSGEIQPPPSSRPRGAAVRLRRALESRGLSRVVLAAGLAAVACSLGLMLGFVVGRPIELRIGPADGNYISGFRLRWQPGTALRWAKAEAEVALPLAIRGPARVALLGARPGLAPVPVEVRQGDLPLGEFIAGPGRILESFDLGPGSARIGLLSRDAEAGKSLQLSSLTFQPGGLLAIVPSWSVLAQVWLGAALLSTSLLAIGWSARNALVLTTACLGAPLAIGSVIDPFATLHLVTKAGALAPGAAGLLLVLMPREVARRAAPVLSVALLLRFGLVFHPDYYYQDVGIHREVATVAIRQGPLELWQRMPEYQRTFQLGLATVAGQWKPFPYPPTLYSLAALSPIGSPEDLVKALGAFSSGVVVALVMLLAGRLDRGGSADLRAGALAAFLPADLIQLLRASYPALLGHAVDTGLVVLLASRWELLAGRRGIAIVALWIAACGLTYNAGPVHLALFVPLLLAAASLRPALPGRPGLLLASALGGAVAFTYYAGTVAEVVRHALHSARADVAEPGLAVADLGTGWDEIGGPFLAVGAVGLAAVLIRRWRAPESRVIAAWAAYIVAISVPVLVFPEVFGYFRRLYFAQALGPLLASLPTFRRGWICLALTAVLLLWSLLALSEFVMPFYVSHSGQIGV